MQLSIPNRALLPRAGPYSHAIVGYGIHWNHPAECTTPARGSCRPLLGIYLRSSSFHRRLCSDLHHGPCVAIGISRRSWLLQWELGIFPRVNAGFKLVEKPPKAKPEEYVRIIVSSQCRGPNHGRIIDWWS